MSHKRPMTLKEAVIISARIIKPLRPFCERVIVAGSIRRQRKTVNDIEIVAVPNLVETDHPYFEGVKMPPHYPIYDFLDKWEKQKKIKHLKRGNKLRQFELLDKEGNLNAVVDLFLVIPPAQFGVIMAIRTGSVKFSKWLVNIKKKKGFRFNKGQLFLNSVLIETPSETSLFKALDIPFIEPEDREESPKSNYYQDLEDRQYQTRSDYFCPDCGSSNVHYNDKTEVTKCDNCGWEEY